MWSIANVVLVLGRIVDAVRTYSNEQGSLYVPGSVPIDLPIREAIHKGLIGLCLVASDIADAHAALSKIADLEADIDAIGMQFLQDIAIQICVAIDTVVNRKGVRPKPIVVCRANWRSR